MYSALRIICTVGLAISALLLACCVEQPEASAAGLTRRDNISKQDLHNPRPAPNEILLPMPCGLSLPLAPVGVPVNGLLWDMETRFGCLDCDRDDLGYYERQYVGHIAAPFTAAEMPTTWQERLPTGSARQQYYFIGRYEITNAQWEAVMNNVCLEPSLEAARPKVDISWYEAVFFTERHMQWLLANTPGSLPRFAGDAKNIGVLRLPTEHEWEYAARGGHEVSANTLLVESFFPMETGSSYADYAVFRDGSGAASREPERIGTKLPNPLGLYDIAGNAAEMTMDAFKFSLGGRLHGSAGGFVRKGGSYLTGRGEIMPGRREECAFFLQDGPARAHDLGFRPVLSGINTPAGSRSTELRAEWKNLGARSGLAGINEAQAPLAAVEALLQNARNSEEQRIFETLRGLLKDTNIAQERHNAEMARTYVEAAIHAVYTLRNLEQRRILTGTQIALIQSDLDRMVPEVREQYDAPFRERLQNWEALLASIGVAMQEQFVNYRALLEKSTGFDQKLLADTLGGVGNDLKGDGLYAAEIKRCYAKYVEQLGLLREGRVRAVTLESLVR